MITRHHLSLTLLCTLILCPAFLRGGDLIVPAGMIAGALAGSVLPDIQMKKPSRFRSLTFAYYCTRFTSVLIVPLMVALCKMFRENPCDRTDKRLTHSGPGIFVILLGVAALVAVPAFLAGIPGAFIFIPALFGGLALGLLLHLVFDLCTRKGIFPFFPFSHLRFRGSIRPCDTADHRIRDFHVAGLAILGAEIIIVLVASPSDNVAVPAGILGFCTMIGILIISSDIRKIPDGRDREDSPAGMSLSS